MGEGWEKRKGEGGWRWRCSGVAAAAALARLQLALDGLLRHDLEGELCHDAQAADTGACRQGSNEERRWHGSCSLLNSHG